MKIKFVDIQNFRKLKTCRIDFAEKETVFVGANNSGKTSAMDAFILFFKEKTRFSTRDFTLSNWKGINEIAKSWIKGKATSELDLSLKIWEEYLPQIDVWINVEPNEIHYVNDIIPTLDWQNGLLGVRLRFEPKNMEELYKDFITAYTASKEVTSKAKKDILKLWPDTMWNFLERRLNNHFILNSYILDL
jgi:predicted ATP-dependent endonuclease of OLD family